MDQFPDLNSSERPIPSDSRPGGPVDHPAEASQSRHPRSWIWRGTKLVLGAPLSAFPLGQITRNGQQLGSLVSYLRQGPKPPRTVPQHREGKLDKAATAFVYEMSETELENFLSLRRRQTARMAYCAFGLGCISVIAWLLRLLNLDATGQRSMAALQFAPFCLIFFLIAFKQAHVNWQLRTGLVGSAGDYLRSAEPFWPRS